MEGEQSSEESKADDDDKSEHKKVMRDSYDVESNAKSGRKVLAFL